MLEYGKQGEHVERARANFGGHARIWQARVNMVSALEPFWWKTLVGVGHEQLAAASEVQGPRAQSRARVPSCIPQRRQERRWGRR